MLKVIQEYGKASVPLLHRKLKIGWNRAAKLFEKLEEEAVLEGNRRILIKERFSSSSDIYDKQQTDKKIIQ